MTALPYVGGALLAYALTWFLSFRLCCALWRLDFGTVDDGDLTFFALLSLGGPITLCAVFAVWVVRIVSTSRPQFVMRILRKLAGGGGH